MKSIADIVVCQVGEFGLLESEISQYVPVGLHIKVFRSVELLEKSWGTIGVKFSDPTYQIW